jgi:hypothetical protein
MPIDVTALGQLSNLRRRDPRGLPEVELFEGLRPRQLRIADAVGNGMSIAFLALES